MPVRLILAFLGVTLGATAGAQPAPGTAPDATPRLSALRTPGHIAVDGRLDEPDWQRAEAASGFLQRDPDEGKPATQRTEVRVLFDDAAIYVGARMYDAEPHRIARRLTRRDDDAEDQADFIIVALDPLHDRLTGAYFTVSAAGSLADGILFNDAGRDDTWDAIWDAAVAIDDHGWTAELRIPFSQLRFQARPSQTWGLNIIRYVQRSNEETWWRLVPKSQSALVSTMGQLVGLDGIRSRRHLELLPYVTARAERTGTAAPGNPFTDGRAGSAGAGLDLKWGIASHATLDAAVNPDFGQVEVDPAVVNLTVFETYFAEKRPFFIEGAQTFNSFGRNGASSYMGFNRTNPTLFYSRRIGRTPQGVATGDFTDIPSATTILGAAKLTGKTNRGWTFNVIEAVTAREYADAATGDTRDRIEVEPLTSYLAARARRDVGQRAGFGALTTLVSRDLRAPGLAAQLGEQALVVGGDGHWFLTGGRDYVVTGSLSGSRVSGSTAAIGRLQRASARYFQRPDATHVVFDPNATSLSGWNLQTDFNRNNGRLRPNASFWAVSPGFDANDAGFVTSVDRMGGHAALVWLKPTPDRVTRRRTFVAAKWNTWNFAGDPMGDGFYASFDATLLNYWQVEVDAHGGRWVYSDRLTRGGPIMRSPGFRRVSADIQSDERKPLVWSIEGRYESRPDGSWTGDGELSLEFKPVPSLSLRVGPEFTRSLTRTQYVRAVTDPVASAMYGRRYVFGALDQTELVMDTRVNLMLTPRMSLQMYLQPLLSTGRYTELKEAAAPRTYDFVRYGQDRGTLVYDPQAGLYRIEPGDGGAAFTVPNPDFSYVSLRVNAVYRWEFRPGSTLYVVWTQQREDETRDGRFAFNQDLSRMVRAPGDNVFMVKASYWFSR